MARITPIRTEADHKAALARIDALMDAVVDSPEAEELSVLTDLVEAYEAKHFPIDLPSPVEAIRFRMEQDAGHTPGPWTFHDDGYVEVHDKTVAYVYTKSDRPIITAAPEMLAALKEVEWIFDGQEDITENGGPNDAMNALAVVRAAIAKATGAA